MKDRRSRVNRNTSTPIDAIVSYWECRVPQEKFDIEWAEASTHCWRCAEKASLQKCHIVPRALGGVDSPENLVLLCSRCHLEAPNCADQEFMWCWIVATRVLFYWFIRGLEEFRKIFHREPFSFVTTHLDKKTQNEMIQSAMAKASHHFGVPALNPSTIAFVMYEVEKKWLTANEILVQREMEFLSRFESD